MLFYVPMLMADRVYNNGSTHRDLECARVTRMAVRCVFAARIRAQRRQGRGGEGTGRYGTVRSTAEDVASARVWVAGA